MAIRWLFLIYLLTLIISLATSATAPMPAVEETSQSGRTALLRQLPHPPLVDRTWQSVLQRETKGDDFARTQ